MFSYSAEFVKPGAARWPGPGDATGGGAIRSDARRGKRKAVAMLSESPETAEGGSRSLSSLRAGKSGMTERGKRGTTEPARSGKPKAEPELTKTGTKVRLIGKPAAVEAEAGLRAAVEEAYGPGAKAAWLSGSFVYRGEQSGRSDVDVVVVLRDDTAVPADAETLARVRAFVDAYLDVHARCGLDPDLDFPGEHVVPATIAEAIAWRGLAAEDGGGMVGRFAPVISGDYWIARPARWFHAWLSMTAFSRFLAGDRDWHARVKLEAWKTVARFVLLRSPGPARAPEALLPELSQFGAKPRYRRFWRAEREWLERALGELAAEGTVTLAGGLVAPAAARLRAWEEEVAAKVAAHGREPGPLLLPSGLHAEVGAYAKARWAAMNR